MIRRVWSLAKLRIPDLRRDSIARLIKEGYDSARALAEATPEALAELVPADIAKRLLAN